jgi:hypothetical protein
MGELSSPQEGRSGLLLPPVVAPGFGFVPPPASPHRGLAAFASFYFYCRPRPRWTEISAIHSLPIYIPTPVDPLAHFATAPPGPVLPLPAGPAAAPSGKIPLRRR